MIDLDAIHRLVAALVPDVQLDVRWILIVVLVTVGLAGLLREPR